MTAIVHKEFCREREEYHRAKAKDSATPTDHRRYHEREASSWAGEALFWEALANRQRETEAAA